MNPIYFLISVLLALGCSSKKPVSLIPANNLPFVENTAFTSFEDLSSPKFKALRAKYQLDTIFH